MRCLFLFIVTLIAFQAQAQRKSRHPEYFLKAQGGYFIDINDYKNYKGFNIANIGWAKYQKGVLQEIDLEFTKYDLEFSEYFAVYGYDFYGREKRTSLELSYNHLFALVGDIDHGLFAGPFTSLLYMKEHTFPIWWNTYPYENTCYCLAIGSKFNYVFALNKRLFVNVSSKVSMLDIGVLRSYVNNPIYPPDQNTTTKFSADFIRPQYQLMLGLSIKL